MHGAGAVGGCFLAVAGFDALVLEAALGDYDAFLFGIFGEVLFTGLDVVLEAGHEFFLLGALAHLELLLEALEDGHAHALVPGVAAFGFVEEGLGYHSEVESEILLFPHVGEVFADGVGGGVYIVGHLWHLVAFALFAEGVLG